MKRVHFRQAWEGDPVPSPLLLLSASGALLWRAALETSCTIQFCLDVIANSSKGQAAFGRRELHRLRAGDGCGTWLKLTRLLSQALVRSHCSLQHRHVDVGESGAGDRRCCVHQNRCRLRGRRAGWDRSVETASGGAARLGQKRGRGGAFPVDGRAPTRDPSGGGAGRAGRCGGPPWVGQSIESAQTQNVLKGGWRSRGGALRRPRGRPTGRSFLRPTGRSIVFGHPKKITVAMPGEPLRSCRLVGAAGSWIPVGGQLLREYVSGESVGEIVGDRVSGKVSGRE